MIKKYEYDIIYDTEGQPLFSLNSARGIWCFKCNNAIKKININHNYIDIYTSQGNFPQKIHIEEEIKIECHNKEYRIIKDEATETLDSIIKRSEQRQLYELNKNMILEKCIDREQRQLVKSMIEDEFENYIKNNVNTK